MKASTVIDRVKGTYTVKSGAKPSTYRIVQIYGQEKDILHPNIPNLEKANKIIKENADHMRLMGASVTGTPLTGYRVITSKAGIIKDWGIMMVEVTDAWIKDDERRAEAARKARQVVEEEIIEDDEEEVVEDDDEEVIEDDEEEVIEDDDDIEDDD